MRVAHSLIILGALAVLGCGTDSSGLGTGAVRVELGLGGVDLDPDGFFVTVDGGTTVDIPSAGSATVDVDAGPHEVVLGGLASNCLPSGTGTRTVTVNPPDTADVAFTINCVAVTGVVKVQATFAGLSPDTNGYQVRLDDGAPTLLMPTGTAVFPGVSGGSHSVDLGDVAANCSPSGSSHADVMVPVGGMARDTGRVTFHVTCTSTSGWVRVSAVATGTNPDPSVLVLIDNGVPLPLATGVGAIVTYLPPGNHLVQLSGIAPNCGVMGANPVNAMVVTGDTTDVAFSLACAATSIQVTTVTTGVNPDTTFQVAVDGAPAIPITSGVSVVVGGLAPGMHSVFLSDVASNCGLSEPNPTPVTTIPDDTIAVVFHVNCSASPQSGVNFVFGTTGTSLDTLYHLTVFGGCGYYCYTPILDQDVPANGVVYADLPAGYYEFQVSGIASNCTGNNYGYFNITPGHLTTVGVAFQCATYGSVLVGLQASGVDIPSNFSVFVDGTSRGYVGPGGAVSIPLQVGTHSVYLNGAGNCTVAGPNPLSVTVDSAAATHVDFTATCVANPTLQVSVTTTGPNAPGSYLVGVDPDYYYGYSYTFAVPSTGTASIRLLPASHIVTLDNVPLNCTVTSPNNVTVTMTLGMTTNLAFTVTCH
jgi:hypothetical protein